MARKKNRLIVLSGPSGVGKSTVIAHLKKHAPQIWLSVSATTRAPRPGEVHGVDYFFVSDDEFDAMVAQGQFLEWATFAGNRYGTPRKAVMDHLRHGPVLLEIDLQGAQQVRRTDPDALLVFLAPPSWEDLVARLTNRGTEAPEVIEARLAVARVEMAAASSFHEVITNSSVEAAAAQLVALCGTAE